MGRHVVLHVSFAPGVTNGVVTVPKEIELGQVREHGRPAAREVMSQTSDVAGDGTTTATVLAQAIVREGDKLVAAGMNPMDPNAEGRRRGRDHRRGIEGGSSSSSRRSRACSSTAAISPLLYHENRTLILLSRACTTIALSPTI